MKIQLAKQMRQLRNEKGLTQGQVAAFLSVSVQAVSKWECGKNLPDMALLPEIADLFGVTIDELIRKNTLSE